MPQRKLILHIGWHKTGTTAIQAFLRQNRELLESQCGVYYPRSGQGGSAHHVLAHAQIHSKPERQALWGQLSHELRTNLDWRVALISSEAFSNGTLQQIQSIKEALTGDWAIQILSYLRPPDEALEARFAERVKRSECRESWREFLASQGPLPYKSISRMWQSAFGADAVIVRPYDRRQWSGGELLIDFFEALGLGEALQTEGLVYPGRVNVSPDAEMLAVLREVSSRLHLQGFAVDPVIFKKYLCTQVQDSFAATNRRRPQAKFFTAVQRKELRNSYREELADLGLRFDEAEVGNSDPGAVDLPEFQSMDPMERSEILIAMLLETTKELSISQGRRIGRIE